MRGPLARLARIDPQLLCPVKHRRAQAQADLTLIGACGRAHTGLVNTVLGLAKSYGERLRGCNVRNMNAEKVEGLGPELETALELLLSAIAVLSERICENDDRIEAPERELRTGGAAAADQGRRHADGTDVVADVGRSASPSARAATWAAMWDCSRDST